MKKTKKIILFIVEGITDETSLSLILSKLVSDSSVQFHGGKAKYALYPVWLLNTTWNGNKYTFAMNGQTGKFVGDLPVDKGAAARWTVMLAAIFSVVTYGAAWLLHLIGLF